MMTKIKKKVLTFCFIFFSIYRHGVTIIDLLCTVIIFRNLLILFIKLYIKKSETTFQNV